MNNTENIYLSSAELALYKCNECYSNKCESDGCYTADIALTMLENTAPCMDGTWDTITPVFNEVTQDPKQQPGVIK
jgi:hypothetical protein